jgi:hypothetical protein
MEDDNVINNNNKEVKKSLYLKYEKHKGYNNEKDEIAIIIFFKFSINQLFFLKKNKMLKNIKKTRNVLFIRKYTEKVNNENNNIKKIYVTIEQLNKGFIIEKTQFMNDEKMMIQIKNESKISEILGGIFGIFFLLCLPGIYFQINKLNAFISKL